MAILVSVLWCTWVCCWVLLYRSRTIYYFAKIFSCFLEEELESDIERITNVRMQNQNQIMEDVKKFSSASPNRALSPPNCAICLGPCTNKSVLNSCMHQFCFGCVLKWSKVTYSYFQYVLFILISINRRLKQSAHYANSLLHQFYTISSQIMNMKSTLLLLLRLLMLHTTLIIFFMFLQGMI